MPNVYGLPKDCWNGREKLDWSSRNYVRNYLRNDVDNKYKTSLSWDSNQYQSINEVRVKSIISIGLIKLY